MESPQENDLAAKLISHDEILSVSFIRSLQATVDDMMRSLDLVIWVLIISAGLLAFVVLYNLNNINISERRRELATLKAVSYTHLDVYKRQTLQRAPPLHKRLSPSTGRSPDSPLCEPVSYTHLDVYKRQPPWGMFFSFFLESCACL